MMAKTEAKNIEEAKERLKKIIRKEKLSNVPITNNMGLQENLWVNN